MCVCLNTILISFFKVIMVLTRPWSLFSQAVTVFHLPRSRLQRKRWDILNIYKNQFFFLTEAHSLLSGSWMHFNFDMSAKVKTFKWNLLYKECILMIDVHICYSTFQGSKMFTTLEGTIAWGKSELCLLLT